VDREKGLNMQRLIRALSILLAMGVVAGCGGNPPASTGPAVATAAPSGSAGAFAVTDKLESLGGPNTPAPKPLATKQKVLFGFAGANEKIAAFLALDMGEFAKENLDVEFVPGLGPNITTLLAQDKLDMIFTSPSGAVLNAINQGIPIRQVAGSSPSNEGSGFYVATKFAKDAKAFDPKSLKGQTLGAAPGGFSSATNYATWATLKEGGLTVRDIKTVELAGGPALISGLQTGLFVGANGGVPFGFDAIRMGLAFMYKPYPFPIAGYYSTLTFIEGRREVATAFWRAVLRTERTYLQGKYHDDPNVNASIAARLGADPAVLKTYPNLVFNLWAPPVAITEVQKMYFEVGDVLQYKEAITPAQVIDQRNIADAAQGK
jgi:ABC-type nitrate/sulfonate/bicarbonate transport system substrate-binding protein